MSLGTWETAARVAYEIGVVIVRRTLAGEDVRDLRVRDVIPETTQLEMAKMVADVAALQKFGQST